MKLFRCRHPSLPNLAGRDGTLEARLSHVGREFCQGKGRGTGWRHDFVASPVLLLLLLREWYEVRRTECYIAMCKAVHNERSDCQLSSLLSVVM
jgi:hypothetical protein